jgi:hemoglobin-like flavoprotein
MDTLAIVRESFGRCALDREFFNDFYDVFMNSSPEIRPMFSRTDMAKQKQLLREGIAYMILFADQNKGGQLAIEMVAEIHDRQHVGVRPDLYRFWVESLLTVVRKHDARCTDEIVRAWEGVVQRGIARFVEVFHRSEKPDNDAPSA